MQTLNKQQRAARTKAEKRFIRELGEHSPHTTQDARVLLAGYVLGAKKRTDWDGMNGPELIKFALHRITYIDGLQGAA